MASSKRDGSVVSWSAQQLFQLFADPMWANSDLCNIEIIVHETHQLRSHSSVLFFLFLLFLFLRLGLSSCHTRLMLYQFQSMHCAVGGTCIFSYTQTLLVCAMWIDSWRSRLSPGNFNTRSFSSSHLANSSVMHATLQLLQACFFSFTSFSSTSFSFVSFSSFWAFRGLAFAILSSGRKKSAAKSAEQTSCLLLMVQKIPKKTKHPMKIRCHISRSSWSNGPYFPDSNNSISALQLWNLRFTTRPGAHWKGWKVLLVWVWPLPIFSRESL